MSIISNYMQPIPRDILFNKPLFDKFVLQPQVYHNTFQKLTNYYDFTVLFQHNFAMDEFIGYYNRTLRSKRKKAAHFWSTRPSFILSDFTGIPGNHRPLYRYPYASFFTASSFFGDTSISAGSDTPFLKFLMASPTPLPNSGNFFPPNRTAAIASIINRFCVLSIFSSVIPAIYSLSLL